MKTLHIIGKNSSLVILKSLLILFLLAGFSNVAQAQVSIGINAPHSSAMLHVESTERGFLGPRMTAAQREDIDDPQQGLLVYQTDGEEGFYYFDGDGWVYLANSGVRIGATVKGASMSGVSGTTQVTGFNPSLSEKSSAGIFNEATGVFTAPSSGRYRMTAVVNYKTTAALSASLGAGVDPYLELRKINSPTSTLAMGYLPTLNLALLVLTTRVILGTGTVVLTGDYYLNAGDQVGLFYVANGLTVSLNLAGADNNNGIVVSIWKH